MEDLIEAIRSPRHTRYARADLNRAIVRRASSAADWELVARLRKDGFTRVPGVDAAGPWLDELDRGPAAFSLLGFSLDGTPLATLRVQDGRHGPLELRRFIDLDLVLRPEERPAAQFGRLSVLRSAESTHVMFAIFKAAWQWCDAEELRTIIIASPRWAKSIYEFMHFDSAGEAGQFKHQYAGGALHETMKLPISSLEAFWRSRDMPLSDQFFAMHHPMLEA